MDDLIKKLEKLEEDAGLYQIGDGFGISFSEALELETSIVDILEDGIVLAMDDVGLAHLLENGVQLYEVELTESTSVDKLGYTVVNEAEYHGRKVTLNKPMKGDVRKSKVYVKKPDGKVVKVNFGDPNMRIKKSNPKRRKSFRARHHCENPGPRWTARHWSCKAW